MKRIALAVLFAISTFAHADNLTTVGLQYAGVLTFTAPEAGTYAIHVSAAPGSPRISRRATLLGWYGEINYGYGYEMTFTADLAKGARYQVLIQNATPRDIDTCADVCDAQVTVVGP